MMKVFIESNMGVFAGYLNPAGEIVIFQGADDTAIARIAPVVKRQAVLDYSSDGVAKAVKGWLETEHERLEIVTLTITVIGSSDIHEGDEA
jgi:hypothetical protein